MSYTEIYGFNKKGESIKLGEAQNAYKGAFYIWNCLSKKYLHKEINPFDPKEMKKVWKLIKNNKVRKDEKIVLLSTFDYMLFRRKEIPALIEAIQSLDELTDNLKTQCKILSKTYNEYDEIQCIGFHQNSISCDMWTDANLYYSKCYFAFDDEEIRKAV